MAIKYNYEFLSGVSADVYLKINDFSVNSQMHSVTNPETEEVVTTKSFVCSANLIMSDMTKTKNIQTISEIFVIDDINVFTLSKAYEKINIKYPGEQI